jgi:hypothetical protein
VTYTPPEAYDGTDSFTYTAPDADGIEQSTTVTVTMGDLPAGEEGENQPPEAVDDSGATFENESLTISVLANDTDPAEDELSIASLTQPAGESAADNCDGTVTYTITDGRGGEATATVSVTVESAPVAPIGPIVVQSGGQVTIQVVDGSSAVA